MTKAEKFRKIKNQKSKMSQAGYYKYLSGLISTEEDCAQYSRMVNERKKLMKMSVSPMFFGYLFPDRSVLEITRDKNDKKWEEKVWMEVPNEAAS